MITRASVVATSDWRRTGAPGGCSGGREVVRSAGAAVAGAGTVVVAAADELAGDGVGTGAAGGWTGVGSSSVSCGQAVGSVRSSGSAAVAVVVVVVEARVCAGDLLAELVAAVCCVCCVSCVSCECWECSARAAGCCSTSDLASRGSSLSRSAVDPLCPCPASLLSEMLLRSELGVRGGGASLPLLTFELELQLECEWEWELRRRKRGRWKRRDADFTLLMPASSRWTGTCSREEGFADAVVRSTGLLSLSVIRPAIVAAVGLVCCALKQSHDRARDRDGISVRAAAEQPS